jgi:membrane protein
MVVCIAIVLLAVLLMSTALSALDEHLARWLPDDASVTLVHTSNAVGSYLITSVMFAAMYKFLPDADVRWRDVWLGAVLAGILFAVGKWLLSIYLARSDIASTYGAVGSLALILVWVYYSAMIVLMGAEFTQVWTRRKHADV